MKRIATLAGVVVAAFLLVAQDADAARLGGGRSFGKQSPTVTQRQATPAPQAAPAPAPSQAAPAQRPAQPPVAQPQRNKWLGPIAGLAAGLGLAALASHFGFGEELASVMMIALLAMVALVVVRMLLSRRAATGPAMQPSYSASGVGAEASVGFPPPTGRGDVAHTLPSEPAAVQALPAAASQWRIPDGFDTDGFVRVAKSQFVRLQSAFDSASIGELREFTTPEMFAELKSQLEERHGAANRTDVVRLDAELLGIESDDREHVASVRFRGLIRENEGAAAEDFDEVWNLTKPAAGSGGWVLAGIQQLQ